MPKIFLGWSARPFRNYVSALTALGAVVERENPDGCDALLLPGGADIHPRFYGQRVDGAVEIDEARDEYELSLLRRFCDARKSVLGVCRGAQLINVALGGTLHQHIDGHAQLSDGVDSTHAVRADDALLRDLYGARFTVNSAHHQSVDALGDGLRAVAWADDGTIEAIRHDSLPVFAVQWHPERLRGETDGSALLRAFLDAV